MAISGVIKGVRFSGMACAVPEKIVDNGAYAAAFGAEQMAKFEKMFTDFNLTCCESLGEGR